MCLTSHRYDGVGNGYNYTIQCNPNNHILTALQRETRLEVAIKLFRHYVGITQKQLAQMVGCSKTQITRIEAGRFQEIRATRYLMTIQRIVRNMAGVELSIDALLNHSGQPNSKTGHLGVCYIPHRKKYVATLTVFKEHFYLGRYSSLTEAIEIRHTAEQKLAEGIEVLRVWAKSIKAK